MGGLNLVDFGMGMLDYSVNSRILSVSSKIISGFLFDLVWKDYLEVLDCLDSILLPTSILTFIDCL